MMHEDLGGGLGLDPDPSILNLGFAFVLSEDLSTGSDSPRTIKSVAKSWDRSWATDFHRRLLHNSNCLIAPQPTHSHSHPVQCNEVHVAAGRGYGSSTTCSDDFCTCGDSGTYSDGGTYGDHGGTYIDRGIFCSPGRQIYS
jgi:hypothetical protein